MTQNDGATLGDAISGDVMLGAHPAGEAMLRAPWVVFASGQGPRGEYGTTASFGIDAALEEQVSAMCREFHSAIGVQEVPGGTPVVLFWKACPSAHGILTQVIRAPHQPGQRIEYEYFNLALSETNLRKLDGNAMRAMEFVDTGELRKRCADGLREPLCAVVRAPSEGHPTALKSPAMKTGMTAQFSQGGTWPATPENLEALLTYLSDGSNNEGSAAPTFATWWPGSKPPRSGVFDIVLRSDATRVAKPHEILAVATELNQILSRSLPAPLSHDTAGGRGYRALLHGAEEIQTRLNEAYFPIALEESPHQWMTRPQKVAGLCQRIADDLPDYTSRLPESCSAETASHCAELAGCYGDLARELQKLRHPNMLHQNAGPGVAGPATSPGQNQLSGTRKLSRKGMQFALVLGALLALGLIVFGISTRVGRSNAKQQLAAVPRKPTTVPGGADQRDQQAIALMRARAEREVFRVARTLAAARTRGVKNLSKSAVQNTVMDAVAQAMSQTPYSQMTPAQKRLLLRMATPSIRAKAMNGIKTANRQRGRARR